MHLKFRYATLLLLAFTVIGLFTFGIFQGVHQGRYPLAILLAALLYGTTFLLGKRLQKMFFTLSVIRFIKNAHGVTSISAVHSFLRKTVRCDNAMAEEIMTLLVAEEIAEICGDSVLLKPHETR